MPRRKFLLVAILLLHTALLGQQGSTQPPPQSPSPNSPAGLVHENQTPSQPQELAKLSSRTDLVLVPVLVTSAGKHVPGLQKEAFRIEENGKTRTISVFEEVTTEKLPTPAKKDPSGVHSNFFARDEQPWRLTAVVLDMINTPSMRQADAKKQLIEYLLRSASREEPMAIFGLNGSGLRQLHPFTRDTTVLISALQKLKLSLSSEERTQPPEVFTDDPSAEQASDEEQLMSDFMQELSDNMSADYQRIASRQTLVAMRQLSNALEAVPGRKTLIWASAGFPFTIDDPRSFGRQGDDLQTEYQETWRALNSANVAVYPVDLSALDFSTRQLPSANSGMSSTQVNNIRGINGQKSALHLRYDKSSEQQLTLHAFADATGGRACITVEELDKCFAEAVDDSRAYYLLGYYLGGDTQPGWRKLKVKVAGDGLHTRYRSGFYVTSRVEDSTELRRKEFVDALASPVQYTGMRLTVRLMQTSSTDPAAQPSAGQKKTAEFMLGVMGDSLTIDREKGNAIDLEVIALAFDSSRKSVGTTAQAVATDLKPDALQKTLQTGLGIPVKIDLPAGKYEVKIAVRDNLSGRLGTVSIPIDLK